MPRYEHVSGTVFALVSLGQLTRAVLAVPAQIGSDPVPVWTSFIAFAVTGALAIWAFRVAGTR
jgi:hypothetical protein